MKRKKAAVVFNDIQGYTSLMQENETYAVALRQRHKEVVDRLTNAYKGTIIQYYGDGTLSIFDNCVDAVECALSMQKEFNQSPQIPLRIGINSGDILLGPDGIYGDSVNIASRIERMSVPGSVLISEHVFDEIKICQTIKTKELGQFELKNVRHPIGIHAIVSDGITVPDPVELAGKIGFKEKSILVLPFYNLSKDPENDVFSDEITEEIIYTLSRIDGLRVTSRTSSFAFKDKPVNLRQLHQELGIDHVLEGSVRKHGNKVRITAQLIHAANDFHLWSETYHREVSDLFQVQDEIASMITNKLKASFLKSIELDESTSEEDRKAEASLISHYHQGRFLWKQMNTGYIDASIHHFKKALEENPEFYPAWPALATAHAFKGFFNQMLPIEAGRLTREFVEEAERINPDHPRTHIAWALYHLLFNWDWPAAVDSLQRIALRPVQDNFVFSNAAFIATGIYQLITGKADAALHTYQKALKFDPLNPLIQIEIARALLYKRDFQKALEVVDNVIRNKPDYLRAQECRGWILFSMGRQREGIESFQYCREHATMPVTGLSGLAYAYARTSQPKLASSTRDLMQSLYYDLPSIAPHYDMALAHLGAQEYKPMFEQLNQAVKARMPVMLFIEVNPIWDEIRRFHEYRSLIEAIHGQHQRPPL
jgi:adenylate cyclase